MQQPTLTQAAGIFNLRAPQATLIVAAERTCIKNIWAACFAATNVMKPHLCSGLLLLSIGRCASLPLLFFATLDPTLEDFADVKLPAVTAKVDFLKCFNHLFSASSAHGLLLLTRICRSKGR